MKAYPSISRTWRRRSRYRIAALFIGFCCTGVLAADRHDERNRMINEIRETAAIAGEPTTGGVIDESVLTAMSRVPRHRFVPKSEVKHAYENRPLPIGQGQTISQPYIVALMTDLLDVGPGDRVFELGTGSGYQAAVLAEIGSRVWSMEVVEDLGARATQALQETGYADRVFTRVGDAYYGWEEEAPFDAIVVTAAGDHIPPPLIRQLKPGGRMVIPVGERFLPQQLTLVEKALDGTITTRAVLPVRFVPLTGGVEPRT